MVAWVQICNLDFPLMRRLFSVVFLSPLDDFSVKKKKTLLNFSVAEKKTITLFRV